MPNIARDLLVYNTCSQTHEVRRSQAKTGIYSQRLSWALSHISRVDKKRQVVERTTGCVLETELCI